MVCAPQLGCDENILSLYAGIECLLQSFSDFILVAIDVCAVDVGVSVLKGVGNGFLDLSGSGLPSSFQKLVTADILRGVDGLTETESWN